MERTSKTEEFKDTVYQSINKSVIVIFLLHSKIVKSNIRSKKSIISDVVALKSSPSSF